MKLKPDLKKHWPFIVALLTFLSLSTGYLLSYNIADYPDGVAHMGYIFNVVANNFPDYRTGKILFSEKYNYLNHPALYYFLVGELIKLLHLKTHAFLVTQIVNNIITCGLIYVIYKTLMSLRLPKSAILFGLFIFLLTPMFLELSVAANNDPLNMLGCAIVFYGLIITEEDKATHNKAILYIAFGATLTALTKATGALAVLCLIICHIICSFRLWCNLLLNIRKKVWGIIIALLSAVIIYYLIIYIVYGRLFPAPQGDPATWFATITPEAPRLGLYDYIKTFFSYNYFSLTHPYGHNYFPDLTLRLNIIDWTWAAITLSWVLLLAQKKENGYIRKRFIIASVFAFIIYISLYFIVVRKMHLLTGYIGAMQARYFYGFIPLASLLTSLVFEMFKNKMIRFGIALIFIFNVILALYPAAINFYTQYSFMDQRSSYAAIKQNKGNSIFGVLVKNMVLEQSFKATGGTLQEVKLFIATFARLNTCSVRLEILNASNEVVYQTNKGCGDMKDNSWVSFKTGSLRLKDNDKYTLRLSSNDGTPENGIAWYYYKGGENPIYEGTPYGPPSSSNPYPDGVLKVNGQEQKGAFAFNLLFKLK